MILIIGPFVAWPLTALIIYKNPFGFGSAFMIGYVIFIFFLDKKPHTKPVGGTPIRKLKFWRHIAEYFPARLIKTADLDPKANYIFCGHPHGIACFSYVANFFIEATGFSSVFPGIRLFPVLLDSHFFAPFHREIALMAGFRGSSREAITNIVQGPPGCSVFLIPGGAPEALQSHPGTLTCLLKRRKGFVRIALQTGTHLVPIIAFGETDLFDVSEPTGIWLKLQQLILSVTKFAIPSISGAGFWSGSGPLPKALPLTTVVGKPVMIKKWTGSTTDPKFAEEVEATHARYCEAVKQLYDEYKDELAPNRKKDIEIL